MNKEISNYITEFESIYNGEPWYGKSLMTVVKDADPGKAFTKSNQHSHSAWEIAAHLFAWKDLLVKRLNGENGASIDVDSAQDWAPLPKEQTAAAWKSLVSQIEENQKQLINALGKWKDDDLDKNFAGTAYPLRTFLNGQIQHDIYHIGQIALLLK
jgi:uncharacterized damage-inducible protein DinB